MKNTPPLSINESSPEFRSVLDAIGTEAKAVINRLCLHEGFSLVPYKDTEGYWTIGRGHRIKRFIKPKLQYTQEEVDAIFLNDFFTACGELMRWKREKYPRLDAARSGVCVELVFWMGLGSFSKFEQMHKALSLGDYHLAALELYNSKLGKNAKLRGRTRTLCEILWEGAP